MSRLAYIVRRLLLAIPTFLGITLVCFALTRVLPGGPVEMRLARLRGLGSGEGGSSAGGGGGCSMGLSGLAALAVLGAALLRGRRGE